MTLNLKLLLLPALFMAFAYSGRAQIKAELVADIWPGGRDSRPHYLTAFKDQLVFTARNEDVGGEPMVVDGDSVRVLKDIVKDGDSHPTKFVEFKDHLYFSANSNEGGLKAYQYDGKTVEEADFGISAQASLYHGPFIANSSHIYYRISNSKVEMELWKYDGTKRKLAATIKGRGSYLADWCFFKDELLFPVTDSVYGTELWRYNGQKAELVQDLYPDTLGSFPEEMVVCDGLVYFVAKSPGVYSGLFQYDGHVIKQVPGIGKEVSSIDQLTPIGKDLYFAGFGSKWGWELWKYNRATGLEVIDIDPGIEHTKPSIMGVVDGELYFRANDGTGNYFMTLDKSKPVKFSTFKIQSSYYRNTPMVRLGNYIYMAGTYQSAVTGNELWRYRSPVSSERPKSELKATLYPNPVNNRLFLSGKTEGQLNWKILDMWGRAVDEGVIHSSFQQSVINTSGLLNGYYILQVKSGNASNKWYFIKN